MTTAFLYFLKPVVATLLNNNNASNVTELQIFDASKLPIHVEYGTNLNQYFKICHCYMALTSYVVITIAVDSFYFTLIQHACGMFAIVLINLKNSGDITTPLATYVAQLMHLFLYFWQAQFLLDYSIIPYDSICTGKWYYTSIRCQKLLLFIRNRAISPCKMTAGKLLDLSIQTFSSVLKTSISYFMVLRSFQ